ncbi:MAG: cupin domain-containing protein [Christensenellales bacterium]
MIISLTDIPWYPPYTPDGSHYHNCLEIGLCLSGEGTVEMSGSSWRFSEGTLLMVPKGVYHAQHNAGEPFTHWRYIAVDSDRLLTQAPHWCAKAIREAMQTTWHSGLYLPPGDEDGARAASIIHMMFDLERSGGNILPELEAYLLLLLTGLARLRSREKEMDVMAGMETPLVPPALEPALLYVSRHYAEEILVEQMARSCVNQREPLQADVYGPGRRFAAGIHQSLPHPPFAEPPSLDERVDSEYSRADGLSVHHDLQPEFPAMCRAESFRMEEKRPESA